MAAANPSGYRFMGAMSHSEFIRRYGPQQGRTKPTRKRTPKPNTKAKMNKQAWTQVKEQPEYPKAEPATVHFDTLRWQPIYARQQVGYLPDYQKNTFTVTVPYYHTQTYNLDYVMRGVTLWLHKKGITAAAIKRSPLGRGQDFGDVWVWLVETAQFPYPIEETLGIRPGFIDLKQILI